MPRIFVSQKRVHQWTEEGRVAIEGNLMTLPELGRVFKLTEAFFIERAVSGANDALKLVGRVKTRNQIALLGGEVLLNSLIIGEEAYEGDPGFVGEAISRSQVKTGRDGASRSGVAPLPHLGAPSAVVSGTLLEEKTGPKAAKTGKPA